MKNRDTAIESSRTWTACAITRARTRLAFSSPSTCESTARSLRSAARSRAAPSSGVPTQPVAISSASTRSSTWSSSSPSRATRKNTAASAKNSTEPPNTPGVSSCATCQISVLMKKNVMNSSSIGSALVTSGTRRPRLENARPAAQRAMDAVWSARNA